MLIHGGDPHAPSRCGVNVGSRLHTTRPPVAVVVVQKHPFHPIMGRDMEAIAQCMIRRVKAYHVNAVHPGAGNKFSTNFPPRWPSCSWITPYTTITSRADCPSSLVWWGRKRRAMQWTPHPPQPRQGAAADLRARRASGRIVEGANARSRRGRGG